MNKLTPSAVAMMLALAACNNESGTASDKTAPPTPESSTARQTREAVDALGKAGRETGEAASSAASDLRDAAAPALEKARDATGKALDSAKEGLNDLTRGAACQTSRGANDAEGIAANC